MHTPTQGGVLTKGRSQVQHLLLLSRYNLSDCIMNPAQQLCSILQAAPHQALPLQTIFQKMVREEGRGGKGGKGREGKGREGKGREGRGGKGRERKGREGKGREEGVIKREMGK